MVTPIAVKVYMMVGLDMVPGHQVSPLGYLQGPKIPNFNREYIENGKLHRYMSNGM